MVENRQFELSGKGNQVPPPRFELGTYWFEELEQMF